MNKWYAVPIVLLILAVPAYLFLFDEGYCPEIEEMNEAKIQLVGDSLFGSDADGCASIAGFMSLKLELRVTDHAIPGATIIGEDGIPSQYVSGAVSYTHLTLPTKRIV